jgi:hypothetical protein
MTRISLAVLASLAALMAPIMGAPKPVNVPAIVTFDDAGMLRGDGGGGYVDGESCVQSWYALPKGNFFLRTVTSQAICNPGRSIVIDLSDSEGVLNCQVAGLDACGVNSVQDVRLVADRLFSASATALEVPFSLHADFQNTAFTLQFVETLPVGGTGNTRTMSTDGQAELWQINGRRKTLIGRYNMPMSVTVTARN